MKKIVMSVGAIVAISSAVSAFAGNEYGYSFDLAASQTPAPPDFGSGIGIENGDSSSFMGAGELFLDSSSSSDAPFAGTLQDINLSESSLTFDLSDFGGPASVTFDLSSCVIPGTDTSDLASVAPFTWNSSQITSMGIEGEVMLDGNGYNFYISAGPSGTEGYMEFGRSDPYSLGNWVAAPAVATPDSTSTALLAGLSTVGLCLFRRKLAKA